MIKACFQTPPVVFPKMLLLIVLCARILASYAMEQTQNSAAYPWNSPCLHDSDVFSCDPYLHFGYDELMETARTSRANRNGKRQVLKSRHVANLLCKFRETHRAANISIFVAEILDNFDLDVATQQDVAEYLELYDSMTSKHLVFLRSGLMLFWFESTSCNNPVVRKVSYEYKPFLLKLATIGILATPEDPLRHAIRGRNYRMIQFYLINGMFDLETPGVKYDLEVYGDDICRMIFSTPIDALGKMELSQTDLPSFTFTNLINGQITNMYFSPNGFSWDRSVNAITAEDCRRILMNIYRDYHERNVSVNPYFVIQLALKIIKCVVLEEIPKLLPFKDLYYSIFWSSIWQKKLPEMLVPSAHIIFEEMVALGLASDHCRCGANVFNSTEAFLVILKNGFSLDMDFESAARLFNVDSNAITLFQRSTLPMAIKLEILENLLSNGLHWNSKLRLGVESWIDTIAQMMLIRRSALASRESTAQDQRDSTGVLAIRCAEAFLAKGLNESYVFSDAGKRLLEAIHRKSDLYMIVRLLLASESAQILPDIKSLIASYLIQYFLETIDFL